VFGALSMLLNGGGVGQLHDIVVELNHAVGGRGPQIHQLLADADHVIASIDARRGDIVAALDQVNRLALTLRANRANLDVALRDLPAGLKVLAGQRAQLVRMLDALGRLGRTATTTVRASSRAFVADLRALDPILRRLAQAGSALPKSLQVLLTYPFPDSVLSAIRGDYLNTFVTNNLNTPGGQVVRVHTNARTSAPPPTLLPPTGGGH
jgi:phospholipid/cholesterol/gamma-HCH transport system substrate-binding protein